MINLQQGDCLELMKNIPDGNIDMVLCDLPYGTMKNTGLYGKENKTSWDETIDTKKMFSEYERIVRKNGAIVLFSQEPYTSHLRSGNYKNISFSYPMIWKKNSFAVKLGCNKNPVSYFEDLNVFRKVNPKHDFEGKHPLREYFSNVMNFIGASSSKEVNVMLGHRRAEHCFYIDSSQFSLCTKKTYQELIERFHIDEMEGFKVFDELQPIDLKFKEYKNRNLSEKYPFIFNLPEGQKYVSNVLEFKKDYQRFHPTQKPAALLEYLIKIYTNEGDVVLDNCMGSGSTGVACVNTNRSFIGMELDEGYFKIAKKRIEEAKVVMI